MGKLDTKIKEFIEKNIFTFAVFILLILTVLIRFQCINFESGDYNVYLIKWYQKYQEKGGLAGLKYPIGNYYVPYNIIIAILSYIPLNPLYLYKGVSILFEYLSAFIIFKISFELLKNKKESILIAIIFLFIPIIWLDSGGWVQCDIIYTFWALCCLLACLKEKYIKAFVYFSIGFCFKQQIIFIFPLLILLYLRKKEVSIYHFFIWPITYIIMGLPAIIAGRDWEVYGVYFNQIKEYPQMFLNFPNFCTLLPNDYEIYALIAGSICILILIVFTLFILKYKVDFTKENILIVSAWVSFTCVMFLPSMHERYNFIPIILVTLYYIALDRKKIWIPIILNIMFMIIYETHATLGGGMIPFDIYNYAYLHLGIYVYITYDFINKLCLKKQNDS